jgi:hypothetical protein
VCRRILCPVYDNKKENWRILTKKVIYLIFKKTYHNRDNMATYIVLVWTSTENRRKQNSQNSIVYEFGINNTKR